LVDIHNEPDESDLTPFMFLLSAFRAWQNFTYRCKLRR